MKKKMEASADKSVHQCHECGKTYKHYRTLWAHQRFDHGEGKTNHECTICDKKFTQKIDLTSHRNVKHDKIKPYSCDSCGRSYASPKSLYPSKHVCKGKPKEVACTQCGKTFALKRFLSDHVRYHHTRAGCSCKVCFAHFKHREQLRRHVAKGCPMSASTWVCTFKWPWPSGDIKSQTTEAGNDTIHSELFYTFFHPKYTTWPWLQVKVTQDMAINSTDRKHIGVYWHFLPRDIVI